jgi:hypothetical protein
MKADSHGPRHSSHTYDTAGLSVPMHQVTQRGVRGLVSCDELVMDRTLMGLVKNWSDLLANGDEEVNQNLRSGVTIGRPIGDDSFVKRVQEMTGRNLRKGKPGKPAKNEGN